MQVLVEGHAYKVANFDNPNTHQVIQFVNKKPMSGSGVVGVMELVCDGTTNEELLAVLIDRIKYLNGLFPCRENSIVLTKLEESLMWLNKRTADRKARNVEGKALA